VFCHVPLAKLELRVTLYQLLHILNRLKLSGWFLLFEEVLHVLLDLICYLAKIFEHNFVEKFIIMLTHDYFRLF
jgi:hypothetical protein